MNHPPSLITFLFTLLLLFITAATGPAASAPTAPPAPTASPPTTAPTSSPTPETSSSPLDPDQLKALKSLHIPIKNPCDNNATHCDAGSPYRHLVSLHLIDCSRSTALTSTALGYLSTLQDFQLINCPVKPVRMPSQLASNLRTFTCINSFKKVSGVWLARFRNLTDLNVSGCNITASGPYVIIGNMKQLKSLTVSNANLTGNLPKYMNEKLTHIDLSRNKLKGKIQSTIGQLENLVFLNLSSNGISGEIPSEIGDLSSLKTLSLSSNSLSGSIPPSLSDIPGLVHVDLSSNQLNGTIPKWIANMKSLKYLNLAGNNFHGVLPFNASFLKKLEVFKVGENSNLCYNHTVLSAKLKLGVARCDKYGMPLSPPPPKEDDSDSSDYDDSAEDTSTKEEKHQGPNKVVLGVAIGLSALVILIVFMVLLAKKCC